MKVGIVSAELIRGSSSLRLNAGSYLCPHERLKAQIARLRQAEASARKGAENKENELYVRKMQEDADIAAGRLIIVTRGDNG